MAIPIPGISISLQPATPTKMTGADLRRQLLGIGLTCPDTEVPALDKSIAEVRANVRASVQSVAALSGRVSTFGILRPVDQSHVNDKGFAADLAAALSERGLTSDLGDAGVNGKWTPKDAITQSADLHYIQWPEHFDWLKTQPNFTGEVTKNHYEEKVSTLEAVKALFEKIGVDAALALVKGLDFDDVEALMARLIDPLDETKLKDPNYHEIGSRVVYLVENYDEKSRYADAIGVMSIEWTLAIQDYKVSSNSPLLHATTLDVTIRSVLYSDLGVLAKDVLAVETHFKKSLFRGVTLNLVSGIPVGPELTIFDKKPPASADTFKRGLLKNKHHE